MIRRRGIVVTLVVLFLAGFSLRPNLVGIGPILGDIRDELDLTFGQAGLLVTIPLLCMGLFAIPAPRLSRRVGTPRAVATGLFFIAAFGLARSFVREGIVLLLLTIPVGVGMGLVGPLLPEVVKGSFEDHPTIGTGIYSSAIQLGSAISIVLAIPVAILFGTWRASLVFFSLLSVLALLGWGVGKGVAWRNETSEQAADPGSWGRPVAWFLAFIFWLSAFPFYGLTAWLTSAQVERGWEQGSAGTLTSSLGLFGIPAGIIVAWFGDRSGERVRLLLGSSTVLVIGTFGLALNPSLAWAWTVVTGGALGALFTLTLTLPLDVARNPSEAAGVASVMLSVGYAATALTPSLLGLLRDLTGSFAASIWVIVVASIALMGASIAAVKIPALLPETRLSRT